MERSNDILLSIGMIVKDEERCLRRCLDALTPLLRAVPSELVIADTGSSDRTREIAAEYADVLFDFEWCNDFSAARNAVMDRCSGKWFLSVDADEYLDGDFSELVEFLTTARSGILSAMVVIRSYATFDIANDDYNDLFALRMVRLATGVRFSGSVHEDLQLPDGSKTTALKTVIFHHDGYARGDNSLVEKKYSRNLALLAEELKKDPGDLHRLLQCLESSLTYDNKRKYSMMIMKAAKSKKNDKWQHWKGAALTTAVICAEEGNYPEFEEWVAAARKTCPNDLHVQIDVSWNCANHYMKKGNYEACLKEIGNYRKGLERHQQELFNASSFTALPIYCVAEAKQTDAYFMESYCCQKLGKWDEALKALANVHLSGSNSALQFKNFMNRMSELWKLTDEIDPSPLLKREFDAIAQDSDDGAKKRSAQFSAYCRSLFADSKEKPPKRPGWQLVASLGKDCDLGLAGLAAGTDKKDEYERLISKVQDTTILTAEVVANAVTLDAGLTQNIYRSNIEVLENLAIGLTLNKKDSITKELIRWTELNRPAEHPGETLWQFLVVNSMINNLDWKEDGSWELYEKYCETAQEYLDTFVGKAVCREQYIYLAPPAARFGWYMAMSHKAFAENDQIGCLKFMRAALKENPAQDAMISYLTKHVEKLFGIPAPEVTAELKALAEQVRTILAKFPPDDPAVMQIKASEEYKLVAHLIEGN